MCLRTIFTAANDTSRNIQQANAMNAVFLEAINVCIQYEPESDLIVQATKVLCGYYSLTKKKWKDAELI